MSEQGPRGEHLLDAATDWVLEHGLGGLSLRPLAAALGTSDRMLLYYAGSKDALVDAVVARASERLVAVVGAETSAAAGPTAAVRALWTRMAEPAAAPYLRLYFEVHGLALQQPDRWSPALLRLATQWRELVASLLGPGPDVQREATIVVGLLEGLLLDLLVTGDRARVDDALDAALARLLP